MSSITPAFVDLPRHRERARCSVTLVTWDVAFTSAFRETLEELRARHTFIRAGRPQTNGAVESLHKTMLEECSRPAFARYLHVRFTGLKRDLEQWIRIYDFDRVHTGRLTRGRIPGEIVYGARKVRAR